MRINFAHLFRRAGRKPEAEPAPPANAVRETPAKAVKQFHGKPRKEPDPQAAAQRHSRRSLIACTLLREGIDAARVPALLDTLEASGLQGFEEKLAAAVKVPQLAKATAERIQARGDFCFLDPEDFAETHLAAGTSVAHVETLLGDIEAAPGVPVPTYARRAARIDVEQEAERERIAAKLNAEADAFDAHWNRKPPAPAQASAPAAPATLGYFQCDAPPRFHFKPEEEDHAI